jgi:hypothetical protein
MERSKKPNKEAQDVKGKPVDEEDVFISGKTTIANNFDILEVPEKNLNPMKPVYPSDNFLVILARGAITMNTLCLIVGGVLLIYSFMLKK